MFTVLVRTMWSYWRYTHRLLPMVGDSSSIRRSAFACPGSARCWFSTAGRFEGSERIEIEPLDVGQVLRLGHRTLVHRRLVGQRAVRNLGDHDAALLDAKHAVARHLADVRRVQVPFVENPLDLRLAPLLDDQQHALLRFGQHDFVRRHAGLALRHERDVDLDAGAAARSHLGGRAGQPRRAHVLDADERVGLHHFEARLEQQLLHERIADLHRRPLLRRLVVELRRRHRRAVNAVASGLGADVIHAVADAGRDTFDDVRGLGDAEAEDVDQRVARVRRVERNLAADRRNADAVAVAGDAGDHAFEQPRRARRVEVAESQRVEQRDRPRAHGEDVADDAADAGRRALIRLDERGVIVRLDLEDRGEPLADIDGARILAGPLQHLRPLGRQRLQVHARALVAAVLRPHHGKDAELGQVRLAAEELHDAIVFVALQPVPFEKLRRRSR